LATRGRPAASVVSSSVLGSLAQLALALLPVPPPIAWAGRGVAVRSPWGGCCAVRAGGPPKTSHAARVVFVFLDCPVPTPAQCLYAEVGASPSRTT
jgi:hypothetical protein